MDRCDPRSQFGSGEWIDAIREVNLGSANGRDRRTPVFSGVDRAAQVDAKR
jgi:hypothetical protein